MRRKPSAQWPTVYRMICSLFFLGIIVSNRQLVLAHPDSLIYVVSEEETQAIIKRIRKECAFNRSIDIQNERYSNEPHCFADFDSTMCWPTTPANKTIKLPCPSYVGGVSISGKATRSCRFTSSDKRNESTGRNVQWIFDEPDYTECVEVDRDLHLEFLGQIGHIGYATSVISLSIAIGIMLKFRRLRCVRNRVHINLFSAIILRGICHFLQLVPWNANWQCKAVTVLNTYTTEATYSWVFVEALFLHNTVLVHVMSENSISLSVYISIGWVTPIVVTFVWVMLRIYVTPGPECWVLDVSAISPSRLLLIIYPSVMILLNAAFFINIIRVIFVKMQTQPTSEANRLRTILRSTLVLVIIFGIYHVIFIPLDLMHSPSSTFQPKIREFAQLYYRQVMESFQGFLVSLILCFLNKEVTSEFKRLYRRSRWRGTSIDVSHRLPTDKDNLQLVHSTQLAGDTELVGRAVRKPRVRRSRGLHCLHFPTRRQSSFPQPMGPRRPSPLCQQKP